LFCFQTVDLQFENKTKKKINLEKS
jgi:hypothetical protein